MQLNFLFIVICITRMHLVLIAVGSALVKAAGLQRCHFSYLFSRKLLRTVQEAIFSPLNGCICKSCLL